MRKKYLEKQIKNIEELTKVIDSLDLDEGVRLLGFKKDSEDVGFIFISAVHSLIKSNQKYCINTTDRVFNDKTDIYLPGGKEEFFYAPNVEEVMKYIKKNALKPLKAWHY